MIIFDSMGLVNYGKSNIDYILLLDLALVTFSITFFSTIFNYYSL